MSGFFKPYRPILKALQNCTPVALPFGRYSPGRTLLRRLRTRRHSRRCERCEIGRTGSDNAAEVLYSYFDKAVKSVFKGRDIEYSQEFGEENNDNFEGMFTIVGVITIQEIYSQCRNRTDMQREDVLGRDVQEQKKQKKK
ncbi:hypothetical protein EDD11_005377 [Mortierella claussenii]|nr:hypothetical protein EDD11_005377 [Mortierella claussenii]